MAGASGIMLPVILANFLRDIRLIFVNPSLSHTLSTGLCKTFGMHEITIVTHGQVLSVVLDEQLYKRFAAQIAVSLDLALSHPES